MRPRNCQLVPRPGAATLKTNRSELVGDPMELDPVVAQAPALALSLLRPKQDNESVLVDPVVPARGELVLELACIDPRPDRPRGDPGPFRSGARRECSRHRCQNFQPVLTGAQMLPTL